MKTSPLPLRPVSLAIVLALAATAAHAAKPSPPDPARSETAAVAVTVEGKVTDIDTPNRLITVEGQDGNTVQVHADETVRNFTQIRKGDTVSLDYLRAVTVDIQPAGSAEPGAYIQEKEQVAKPGERPGAGAAEVVTVLAPIRAIDTKQNTITVEGPRGNVVTLDVRNPEHQARLPQLKVGDMLRIAFTEAAAVQVRPKGR
ncbi:hypothetical protein [Lysobacter arvi]|uniref:Copper-binding protein n=1 Tax=Lysobacter arvi TaxID=3038776 RepID=A0ABU1CG95_9GAMM|nr:hypothetical protein [Lysobacter arvi]MDR0183953.1 hypothetical protein [Lysobacter arvi]